MAANEIDAASSARNVLKVLTTTPREDAEVVYQGKVAGVQKNGVKATGTMPPQISVRGDRHAEFTYPRLACFRRVLLVVSKDFPFRSQKLVNVPSVPGFP